MILDLDDSENLYFQNEEVKVEKSDEEEFAEDSYLMVSQLHWEDDVIWNGDDIKHKLRHKFNTKNNAAGWVPSSDNRTAQAFSQPGKGIPVPVAPKISTPLQMHQKNKMFVLSSIIVKIIYLYSIYENISFF